MVKTILPFNPSQVQAPQFTVTLDTNSYTMTVTWNLFAQRYYITLTDQSGNRILTAALVGSPVGQPVSAISWANSSVTVTTLDPHGLPVGRVSKVTIEDCTPDEYNGTFQVLVINRQQFTYKLATDPGAATVLGAVNRNINLVPGLFASTVVYREPNRQFEITD